MLRLNQQTNTGENEGSGNFPAIQMSTVFTTSAVCFSVRPRFFRISWQKITYNRQMLPGRNRPNPLRLLPYRPKRQTVSIQDCGTLICASQARRLTCAAQVRRLTVLFPSLHYDKKVLQLGYFLISP